MEKPLLSICIPTYNRAEVLNATLNEITSLKDFDESVEIVISDTDVSSLKYGNYRTEMTLTLTTT